MKQNNVLKIVSFSWRHEITQTKEHQNVSLDILYARLNSDEYIRNGYVDSVDERIKETIFDNLNSNQNISHLDFKTRKNKFSPQMDFSILSDEIVQKPGRVKELYLNFQDSTRKKLVTKTYYPDWQNEMYNNIFFSVPTSVDFNPLVNAEKSLKEIFDSIKEIDNKTLISLGY